MGSALCGSPVVAPRVEDTEDRTEALFPVVENDPIAVTDDDAEALCAGAESSSIAQVDRPERKFVSVVYNPRLLELLGKGWTDTELCRIHNIHTRRWEVDLPNGAELLSFSAWKLKRALEDAHGLEADALVLRFRGRVIKDKEPLVSCGVVAGASLLLGLSKAPALETQGTETMTDSNGMKFAMRGQGSVTVTSTETLSSNPAEPTNPWWASMSSGPQGRHREGSIERHREGSIERTRNGSDRDASRQEICEDPPRRSPETDHRVAALPPSVQADRQGLAANDQQCSSSSQHEPVSTDPPEAWWANSRMSGPRGPVSAQRTPRVEPNSSSSGAGGVPLCQNGSVSSEVPSAEELRRLRLQRFNAAGGNSSVPDYPVPNSRPCSLGPRLNH